MDITNKRFELAPQDRIFALEKYADKFFREVLGYDYYECLVTDESAWYDFVDNADVVTDGVYRTYGIKLDDVESEYRYIVDILDLIRLLSNNA